MSSRVASSFLKPAVVTILFSAIVANASFAQDRTKFTGDDWLVLQAARSVKAGNTIDDAKDHLLRLYAGSDLNGGGVSKSDYTLHVQIIEASSRAQRMTRWLMRDLDGDGVVTSEELNRFFGRDARKAIRHGGIILLPTPDQVSETKKKLVEKALRSDLDGNGNVEFSEILGVIRAEMSALPRSTVPSGRVPMTLDADGNGVVEIGEFKTAADRVLRSIDSNGDGKFSKEEIAALARLASGLKNAQRAARKEQHLAEKYRKRAETCAFPEANAEDKVVLLSARGGKALSSVGLGGDDHSVSVANIWIEKGAEPLYLVLNSIGSMIWQVSGSTDRLRKVVVNQTRMRSKSAPHSGVVGVPRSKVHIAPVRNCIDFVSRPARPGRPRMPVVLKPFAGRDADYSHALKRLAAISIPTGIVDQTTAYANTLPEPKNTEAKAMWVEMLRTHPGGVVRIDAKDVVSRVPAASYKVLPRLAGLAQLLDEGALRVLETDRVVSLGGLQVVNPNRNTTIKLRDGIEPTYREVPSKFQILRKMHFPAGLAQYKSIPFVLAPGVPEPEGNPGRSCVMKEATGELILGNARDCR